MHDILSTTEEKKIPDVQIKINDIIIEQVKTFSFFGLTVDRELNWEHQISDFRFQIYSTKRNYHIQETFRYMQAW